MNKALPWNVNGVGFDAREAAREAARRQGKSLGEWLHGVIADHAADLGVNERDIAGQQRIDAVTSKLERLSARSADHDRRLRAGRVGESTRRRTGRDRDDDFDDRDEPSRDGRVFGRSHDGEPRRRHDSVSVDATEYLLEEAIDAMERRASRAERHTDDALQSFSKLLERNEANRDRERESVTALAQKLSEIESRLTDRQADDNPIKGALARLESRLETIGRRGAAEAVVRQQVQASIPAVAPEPFFRLEEKLNSILEAVHGRPPQPVAEASPIAFASYATQGFQARDPALLDQTYPARVFPEQDNGRLGTAVADIARRQQMLESPPGAPVSLKQAILRRGRPPAPAGHDVRAVDRMHVPGAPRPRADDPAPFIAMQNEIASLASTIESLRRDVVKQRNGRAEPAIDIDGLRAEIATMSGTLSDLAPRSGLSALETSIRTLSDRIEASRDQGVRESALRPLENAVGTIRRALNDPDPRAALIGLEDDLCEIGGKIGDLNRNGVPLSAITRLQDQMQEIRDLIATATTAPHGVERIEHQIASLTDRFDRQMRHQLTRPDFEGAADERRPVIAAQTDAFGKIETRLEALAAKIDRAVETRRDEAQSRQPPSGELDTLETLVRDLSQKMEVVQAPDASHQAYDALQQQVALLSARFERSDDGLAKLTSLERSMRDLFAHLEETRSNVETSAARAAREVLKIAMEEGRAQTDQGAATSLVAMQALQDQAEARTASTLTAVHGTLAKVVDRLSTMEADLAEARKRPAPRLPEMRAPEMRAPELRAPEGPAPELRAPEIRAPQSALDPVLHHRPGENVKKTPTAGARSPLDLEDESGRADFIAAARRAAKVAQADPAVAELKRAASAKGTTAVRAGLIEQSRDYITRHKRPVLLSIAALFVVLGTMAIIQRIGLDDGDSQTADAVAAPPARVASAAEPVALPRPVRQNEALTPSALPTSVPAIANPIPGSDPIQTGSIPSIPSFAAAAPRPRPALPANLKAMAQAGDGAAEYVLGAQYAEGSVVPRDFALAAQWYQKAAAQNLAPAQYRLASLYEKGLGVTQDKTKAKTLYLQAAEAGNPRAMHNLAVLLADGAGKPDYDGAATWFRKAAQYGIHDSQYNLAILLARGIGVQQSLVQSYQWFAIAAAQGDADAAKKRDEVGTKLSANDLAVAKALADSFRPRIANIAATEVQLQPGA